MVLAACGPPPEPAGIVREPAPVVADVTLPDVAADEAFAAYAEAIRERTGCEVAIIDAGDYGACDCLGRSAGVDAAWLEGKCDDNPLGQDDLARVQVHQGNLAQGLFQIA